MCLDMRYREGITYGGREELRVKDVYPYVRYRDDMAYGVGRG